MEWEQVDFLMACHVWPSVVQWRQLSPKCPEKEEEDGEEEEEEAGGGGRGNLALFPTIK